MRLTYNEDQGYWNDVEIHPGVYVTIRTHAPSQCAGEMCDIHSRELTPERDLPLNWREDRGMVEFICEHGVGHPTTAQRLFWSSLVDVGYRNETWFEAETLHGCCGCCAGVEGPHE